MEKWRIVYLALVIAGFLIGWITTPKIAVVVVWTCVIVAEVIHRR